jgi:transposase
MDTSILPYYTDEEVTQRLGDLIGRQFAEEMIELVEERTQRPARPIGFRYGGTLDFVPERVNLMLDEEGRITGFEFN